MKKKSSSYIWRTVWWGDFAYISGPLMKGVIFIMCKYCKLKTLNEVIGEKSNNAKTIGVLKDGSQFVEVCLNRYIVENDDVKNTYLALALGVNCTYGSFTVNEKIIPIKYCPFCGEEL